MIASLTATAVALAASLPILALGENLRGRAGRRLDGQNTSTNTTRKDI